MSYDERCYNLADEWLEDEPGLWTEANSEALAQEIQNVIEAFVARAKENYEPPDSPGWEGGFAKNH